MPWWRMHRRAYSEHVGKNLQPPPNSDNTGETKIWYARIGRTYALRRNICAPFKMRIGACRADLAISASIADSTAGESDFPLRSIARKQSVCGVCKLPLQSRVVEPHISPAHKYQNVGIGGKIRGEFSKNCPETPPRQISLHGATDASACYDSQPRAYQGVRIQIKYEGRTINLRRILF